MTAKYNKSDPRFVWECSLTNPKAIYDMGNMTHCIIIQETEKAYLIRGRYKDDSLNGDWSFCAEKWISKKWIKIGDKVAIFDLDNQLMKKLDGTGDFNQRKGFADSKMKEVMLEVVKKFKSMKLDLVSSIIIHSKGYTPMEVISGFNELEKEGKVIIYSRSGSSEMYIDVGKKTSIIKEMKNK